eukprot:3390052-Amphidinium_carterae.1
MSAKGIVSLPPRHQCSQVRRVNWSPRDHCTAIISFDIGHRAPRASFPRFDDGRREAVQHGSG